MLSQLSYAPVFASGVAHLSDVVHYTQVGPVCQALFSIFYFELFCVQLVVNASEYLLILDILTNLCAKRGLKTKKIFFTDKSA